jgi:hypothetical protein
MTEAIDSTCWAATILRRTVGAAVIVVVSTTVVVANMRCVDVWVVVSEALVVTVLPRCEWDDFACKKDAYTVGVTSTVSVAGARFSQSLQNWLTALSGLLLSKAENRSLGQSKMVSVCRFPKMFFPDHCSWASWALTLFTSTWSSVLRCKNRPSVVTEKERMAAGAKTERVKNMIEHSSEWEQLWSDVQVVPRMFGGF